MNSSSQRHARISELYLGALELEESDREAFLHRECTDDPSLVREVESLLDAAGTHAEEFEAFSERGLSRARREIDSAFDDDRGPVRNTHAGLGQVGPYRIIGQLGEGGMGVVFEAERDFPSQRVALKLMRPSASSSTSHHRFENEANVLARLQHPSIAQLYDFGTVETPLGTQPYFALELVRGLDLRTHVARKGLELRAQLELVALVCDAIQHAHDQGIVHRDLKPANVLVDDTGRPKVLDFGIARVVDEESTIAASLTQTGQIVGTLAYMAPEQLSPTRTRVTGQVDVYALGVITFELIAGRTPHSLAGLTPGESIQLLVQEDATRLEQVTSEIPRDVATIVNTALERNPERRYASPAMMAADLRRYFSDRPIHARPPSSVYRLQKFVRRNKAVVATLLTLLGGLIGTIGFAIAATSKSKLLAEGQAREREANVELTHTLYAAETRLASSVALKASAFPILQSYVERWDGTELGEECGGWELGLFAAMVDQTSQEYAVPQTIRVLRRGPNGEQYLVSVGGVIQFRGVDDHNVEAEIPNSGNVILDLAWNGDGTRVAAASLFERLRVWDVKSGEELWNLSIKEGEPSGVEWSTAVDVILTTSFESKIRGHAADSGRILWELSGVCGEFGALTLAPDGKRFACIEGSVIQVYDLEADGHRRSASIQTNTWINTVSWCPTRDWIAFGGFEGHLGVCDVKDRKVHFANRPHSEVVTALGWSPDGQWVTTASWDGSVLITEPWLGREIRRIPASTENIHTVEWSPDGRELFVAGDQAAVTVWPMDTAPPVDRGWLTNAINATSPAHLVLHPDGEHGVAIYNRQMVEIAVSAPPRALEQQRAATDAAWNATGEQLARIDGRVVIVEGADDREVRSAELPESREFRLAWSPTDPDGLAVVSDTCIWRMDPHTGELRQIDARGAPDFCSIQWTNDGKRLIHCCGYPAVRLLDADTGEELHHDLPERQAFSVSRSPRGSEFVVGMQDDEVVILDDQTLAVKRVLQGHVGEVLAVAWSPDGSRIASGGRDQRILIWDADRAELVATLEMPDVIWDLVWTPDGRRLLSVLQNGEVTYWSSRTP